LRPASTSRRFTQTLGADGLRTQRDPLPGFEDCAKRTNAMPLLVLTRNDQAFSVSLTPFLLAYFAD